MEEIDIQKMYAQFAFLNAVRRMSEKELRKYHKERFAGSKYDLEDIHLLHRSILERRLFFQFCIRNYHWPKDSLVAKKFIRKARKYLTKTYAKQQNKIDQTIENSKDLERFSKENIAKMSIEEVDSYLAILGLYIKEKPEYRRKVLWEWYNRPSKELIKHMNRKKKVKPVRRGKLVNKYVLRDIILAHPDMNFDTFKRLYGRSMPTVTRVSFNHSRSMLNKAGYNLPVLAPGPSKPAIRTRPKISGYAFDKRTRKGKRLAAKQEEKKRLDSKGRQ